MRPVARPAWDPRWHGRHAGDVVRHALGPFCSACELRLTTWGAAYDARTGAVAPARTAATAQAWGDLLVLCEGCTRAVRDVAAGGALVAPLRPDHDRTFSLFADAPIAYEPRALRVRRAGAPAEEAVEVRRVVAVGRSDRGRATVRRYALNTPWHDPATDELLLPGDAPPPAEALELLELDDARMLHRTEVWEQAEPAAALVADTPPGRLRDTHLRLLAQLVQTVGCWSVWATLLATRTQDRALVAALLVPAPEREGPAAPERLLAAGPPRPAPPAVATAFRSTRADWLAEPPAPAGAVT